MNIDRTGKTISKAEPDPSKSAKILSRTESLCPECFARIDALRLLIDDTVYMEKRCEKHGTFRTRIWQGEQSYKTWVKPKLPIARRFHMVPEERGCPFDCGLCPAHLQHTCTAVLEVTSRCNFSCPFCFASSVMGKDSAEDHSQQRRWHKGDPSLEEISRMLGSVYNTSPGCNLQISGGEATLRPDLPMIIAQAKRTGFGFIQLNTNGFFLAEDPNLAATLKNAGLSSVFLQFDGTSDSVYEKLRGRALYRIKQRAVAKCIENEIGVILVPTVVPGVNVNQIGNILSFAIDHAPGVRGVHFQPVSYFGRHPGISRDMSEDLDRITIPEVLLEIESQTQGKFRQQDFKPPSCEHALCSFNGKFLIMEDGTISPLAGFSSCCSTPVQAEQGARQAVDSVARQWRAPQRPEEIKISGDQDSGKNDQYSGKDMDRSEHRYLQEERSSLDHFIRRARTHTFSVSGMAFQDVWNIDLERLKGCCIHSVARDGRLIPFCAYNLTNRYGEGLYRKKGSA